MPFTVGSSIYTVHRSRYHALSFYRVCIVCLAPSHVLLSEHKGEILSVDYQIGKVDRLKNQVSGKRKNKSLFLETMSVYVCHHAVFLLHEVGRS